MISILLPYYLNFGFKALFEKAGFTVYWAPIPVEFEEIIQSNDFDVALEWQTGPADYMVHDLLVKYRKSTPIFLCLNWNGKEPKNLTALGYAASLEIPFVLADFAAKLREVLPGDKSDEAYRIYLNTKK